MTTTWIVVGVCLAVEALFSGSEVAAVSADRLKTRQGAEAGRRGHRLLLKLLAAPQKLLATSLFCTQLAVVTATVTVTLALTERLGETRGELVTLLALTPLLVIFGEIVDEKETRP